MFREHRLLSQNVEGPRGPETSPFRDMFSNLGERARNLFGRLTGRDRDSLRSTVDTFGRDFNRVRGSLVEDVRRTLPPAVRTRPEAEEAFREEPDQEVSSMLDGFRKESAQLDQQRDKVFNETLSKLEALRQEMIKEENAEDQAAAKTQVAAPRLPLTPATPAPVDLRAGEFPATPEGIRQQFRYTAERFGTPEGYARFLAEQLTTDDRWNKFLQAMFEYAENSPGTPARILNLNNIQDTDSWTPPLQFMTTYNANGKISGDCEDLAFFATHIARMQGKAAFNVGLGSNVAQRTPENTFRLRAEGGHVFSGWFEPGTGGQRVLKMVTTRGIVDANNAPIGQAGLFTATANAGETDAQLITRLYNQVASVTAGNALPSAIRTMDAGQVQNLHVLAGGNGFALHGNVALLLRHGELDGLLQRNPPDHAGVVRIVREELARDQGNLGLHASLIQFLLLANDRPAIEPAMDAFLTALRATPPVSRNIVTVAALRDSLMSSGFTDPKTQELNRLVQTWLETNVRPV